MSIIHNAQNSNNLRPEDAIVYYTEDEELGLCDKTAPLGGGTKGDVYLHRSKPNLVVKRSFVPLDEEFKLGFSLRHPCIVKMHTLFVKTYDSDRMKYQLVMQKIEGRSFKALKKAVKTDPSQALSQTEKQNLVAQACHCCHHLFDKGVYWNDLHPTNVFVTDKGKNLMICDLGEWQTYPRSAVLAQELFKGSIDIVSSILSPEPLPNYPCHFCDIFSGPKTCELDLIPEDEAPIPIDTTSTKSYCYNKNHNRCMGHVNAQFVELDDADRLELIDTYFLGVIERL